MSSGEKHTGRGSINHASQNQSRKDENAYKTMSPSSKNNGEASYSSQRYQLRKRGNAIKAKADAEKNQKNIQDIWELENMQNKYDSSSDLSESMKNDMESMQQLQKKQESKNEKRRRAQRRGLGMQWTNTNLFGAASKKPNRNSLLQSKKSAAAQESADKYCRAVVTPTKTTRNVRMNNTPGVQRQPSNASRQPDNQSKSSWYQNDSKEDNLSQHSNTSALQTKRKEFLNTKQMSSLQGDQFKKTDGRPAREDTDNPPTFTDATTSLGFLKQREMVVSKTGQSGLRMGMEQQNEKYPPQTETAPDKKQLKHRTLNQGVQQKKNEGDGRHHQHRKMTKNSKDTNFKKLSTNDVSSNIHLIDTLNSKDMKKQSPYLLQSQKTTGNNYAKYPQSRIIAKQTNVISQMNKKQSIKREYRSRSKSPQKSQPQNGYFSNGTYNKMYYQRQQQSLQNLLDGQKQEQQQQNIFATLFKAAGRGGGQPPEPLNSRRYGEQRVPAPARNPNRRMRGASSFSESSRNSLMAKNDQGKSSGTWASPDSEEDDKNAPKDKDKDNLQEQWDKRQEEWSARDRDKRTNHDNLYYQMQENSGRSLVHQVQQSPDHLP